MCTPERLRPHCTCVFGDVPTVAVVLAAMFVLSAAAGVTVDVAAVVTAVLTAVNVVLAVVAGGLYVVMAVVWVRAAHADRHARTHVRTPAPVPVPVARVRRAPVALPAASEPAVVRLLTGRVLTSKS